MKLIELHKVLDVKDKSVDYVVIAVNNDARPHELEDQEFLNTFNKGDTVLIDYLLTQGNNSNRFYLIKDGKVTKNPDVNLNLRKEITKFYQTNQIYVQSSALNRMFKEDLNKGLIY